MSVMLSLCAWVAEVAGRGGRRERGEEDRVIEGERWPVGVRVVVTNGRRPATGGQPFRHRTQTHRTWLRANEERRPAGSYPPRPGHELRLVRPRRHHRRSRLSRWGGGAARRGGESRRSRSVRRPHRRRSPGPGQQHDRRGRTGPRRGRSRPVHRPARYRRGGGWWSRPLCGCAAPVRASSSASPCPLTAAAPPSSSCAPPITAGLAGRDAGRRNWPPVIPGGEDGREGTSRRRHSAALLTGFWCRAG